MGKGTQAPAKRGHGTKIVVGSSSATRAGRAKTPQTKGKGTKLA